MALRGPVIDEDVLEGYRALQQEGRPDVVAELIDSFLSSYRARLERLRSAVGSGIPQHISAAAQALKGIAGSVGAMVVWGLCAHLEAEARAGAVGGSRGMFAEIELEVGRAVEALRGYRQG